METRTGTTSVAGDFYQRGGADAGKVCRERLRAVSRNGGRFTLGGANWTRQTRVIPKSEAFFEPGTMDGRSAKQIFVRAVEFDYGQHWYWYRAARILTLNGTTIVSFPQEWTLSLGPRGARQCVFLEPAREWRPSGNRTSGISCDALG